jgi:adenine/guanine/hypoxanthine permease
MKPFVKGDLDGFFALALDNLVMLLLMSSLCVGLLGFSADIFYRRMLPGAAIGLVVGNLFYAREALRLARAEDRSDVCAIPYGINIFSLLVYVFMVMLPAQQAALASGRTKEQADAMAWQAGLIACLGSGVIEFAGSFVAHRLQTVAPRAALLAAPAGLGLMFLSVDYMFRCFTYPVIGFTTLALVFAVYFGRVRLKGGIPAGALVLALGAGLAWAMPLWGGPKLVPVGALDGSHTGLNLPWPALGEIGGGLRYFVEFLPVIVPMGLLNLIGSLQNIESAAAAGDRFDARRLLAVNGLGTLGAGLFGSPFPTSIYFGHPGWKALGARAGYSTLNAVFFTAILLTGSLSVVIHFVPVEAGMAILVWIGFTIFSQAFTATPARHAPAVAAGLVPAFAAYVAVTVKNTLAGTGLGARGAAPFPAGMLADFPAVRQFFVEGVFALDAGNIYASVVWAATTAAVIDRQFRRGAVWMLVGAALSASGLMHAFAVTSGDVVGVLKPAWKWVWGYGIFAAVLALVPWVSRPDDEAGH